MKDSDFTVSDLSRLIAAREETRAELHRLALDAWEHWREVEARVEQLEARLFGNVKTGPGSNVYPIDTPPSAASSEACPLPPTKP